LRNLLQRIVNARSLYDFVTRTRLLTGKYLLLFVCIVGLVWYAVFTRRVVGQIKRDAVNVTQTYAELVRTAVSQRLGDREIKDIFKEIIRNLQFPIIITDTSWTPIVWKNVTTGPFYDRESIRYDDTSAASMEVLRRRIEEFRELYPPKTVEVAESGTKMGYLVYGNSDLVRSIAWLPFVEVGLIIALIFFASLALHNIRVTERSNLWVGLAKETAHQLGTPISSLMGWVEYMLSAGDPDVEEVPGPEEFREQVRGICGDMKRDLTRLRKITDRFSQIGSVPALAPCDINQVLEDAIEYFSMRLPLLGRRIEIRKQFGDIPRIPANRALMEWVFENLLKNAMDAIKRPDGMIEIRTESIDVDGVVRVYHKDNGKGVSWEEQKKVFSPGYTTKKHGWGLGLTLAKRIVEDYHNGSIYVNWSQKGQGTVFHIDLPRTQQTNRS